MQHFVMKMVYVPIDNEWERMNPQLAARLTPQAALCIVMALVLGPQQCAHIPQPKPIDI
jgi:hypothetical protein